MTIKNDNTKSETTIIRKLFSCLSPLTRKQYIDTVMISVSVLSVMQVMNFVRAQESSKEKRYS